MGTVLYTILTTNLHAQTSQVMCRFYMQWGKLLSVPSVLLYTVETHCNENPTYVFLFWE
jgi:hypothetical protein